MREYISAYIGIYDETSIVKTSIRPKVNKFTNVRIETHEDQHTCNFERLLQVA